MAEEYLHAGNYQMAKRFFERIVQPYQKEGWWLVLASVQRSLLTCAIHLGQVLVANRKRPGHVRGGGGKGRRVIVRSVKDSLKESFIDMRRRRKQKNGGNISDDMSVGTI